MVHKQKRATGSLFTSVPMIFTLPAVVGGILIIGPLCALGINIPWADVGVLMGDPQVWEATRLSVSTALISTLCCGLLGLPMSLVLSAVVARSRWQRAGSILYGLLYTPIIMSPVVSGLALTFFWGRRGMIGEFLHDWGVNIPFTPVAVILAQIFVGLPFFVATAVTTLRAIPREYEELAVVEGATAGEVTRKVLLPLAAPGIATAFLLSFARALGEYGATVTFAGNIAGKTRTIPLNIELMLSSNLMDQALGSALMLISLYLLVVGIALLIRILSTLRGSL